METFDDRLYRFLNSRPVNIFGWMTVWAQNELAPQVKLVTKPGAEVLLFVGCHTFIQGFMEKTYGIRGKAATHEFLLRFMDGSNTHDQFSAVFSEIHEMRNVMAHQMYSAATHDIAFNFKLKHGWHHIGTDLHINPTIFGEQFVAALDGGRLRKWRNWTSPELLMRQKWRFISDWLHLKPKNPLRIAVETFAQLPTMQDLATAEAALRKQFETKYGV
jgi:hypothetical protein